jgi:soluble lytic murein transglycosylase-like protein
MSEPLQPYPVGYPSGINQIDQTSQSNAAQNDFLEIIASFLETLQPTIAGNSQNEFTQSTLAVAPTSMTTADFLANMLLTNNQTTVSAQAITPSQNIGTPADIQSAISASAKKYGIDENLIHGIIEQESGMNPSAVSSAGAIGLMQLMPATGAELGASNLYDPVQNIDAGTHYFANLLTRYNGNVPLALAAYNAGPGAVDQYGGIPPYKETQNYVAHVMHHAQV